MPTEEIKSFYRKYGPDLITKFLCTEKGWTNPNRRGIINEVQNSAGDDFGSFLREFEQFNSSSISESIEQWTCIC